LFCPTPLRFKRLIYREREGDIENRTKVGKEEDGSVQYYLTQKKKNEIEGGQRVTRREKEENVCELCD
jgi:hypothetical protein